MQKTKCIVFIYLPGQAKAVPAGLLLDTGEGFRFQYGKRYLERKDAMPVDMLNLPLQTGDFFLEEGSLGAIRDAAPDYWGRLVFAKLSSISDPGEIDYLLAPNAVRIGNLDCRHVPNAPEPAADVPEIADLPEIIQVAERVDEGLGLNDQQRKIAMLLRAGSSLGERGRNAWSISTVNYGWQNFRPGMILIAMRSWKPQQCVWQPEQVSIFRIFVCAI